MTTNTRKHTIDMMNQPGIRHTPVTRDEIKSVAEALGLDPMQVLSLEVDGKGVTVTATLVDVDGHKVLSQGGYIKHTYEIPAEDELCESGSIDEAGE